VPRRQVGDRSGTAAPHTGRTVEDERGGSAIRPSRGQTP
jgi:hypothetical protein